MPGATSTHYTARFLSPDLIVRGKQNVLSCPVYLDGALVAPAVGGTLTIYDARGIVVESGTITVVGSVATYTWTPSSSLTLEEGWRLEWSLTIDGDPFEAGNDAALVRASLHPVITDQDLYRRRSSLDPSGSSPIHSLTDLQDFRDEAWAEIQLRLIEQGNRPNLILSPSSLRQVHLALSLALIFDDFKSRLNTPAFAEDAASYREEYEASWKRLNFKYDESGDDGEADSASSRRSARPTVWLCGKR